MLRVNFESWQQAELLPPSWFAIVAAAALRKKDGWLLVSIVACYLLLSLVVWQPSRYVFFILFPMYAVLILGAVQWTEWMGRWKQVGACLLFGGLLLVWPAIPEDDGFLSTDYPLSWPTMLPQISSYFSAEIPLDCSKQDLLLSQLSAHRTDGRPFLPTDEYCERQFRERRFQQILSSESPAPAGWKTVDSWRFERGAVWLYAIDNQ